MIRLFDRVWLYKTSILLPTFFFFILVVSDSFALALQFTDRDQITDASADLLTQRRLVATGITCGGVFSLLLLLFVYLRLNHATRGFYSRRMQMGAAILVLLIMLLCYYLNAAFY